MPLRTRSIFLFAVIFLVYYSGSVNASEHLCLIGQENRNARLGVVVNDGILQSVVYYSKWDGRACSLDLTQGKTQDTWARSGSTTIITVLANQNNGPVTSGTITFENKPDGYYFTFRDIDRQRFCKTEGRIKGTIVLKKNFKTCVITGTNETEAFRNMVEDSAPQTGAAPAVARPRASGRTAH